jgi:hypothetical protein
VALALGGCTTTIGKVQWTQTAGPATVSLIADKSQATAFDATSPGSYTFSASWVDGGGEARSQSVSLDVTPPVGNSLLAVRGHQAVRMGSNVSVRAWPAPDPQDSVRSVAWTQLEGPAVTLLATSDSHVALFVAPQVTRDTLIRMQATVTMASGTTHSDEALVLVERFSQAPAADTGALWNGDQISRVYAYRAAGPWANALVRCTYDAAQRTATPCPLSTLPFLAQETAGATPSVEQVMNRVVVSHDWLGRNFEAFLRTQDPQGDMRRMLNSVTAVVLGTHVRPSFYWSATGAIYLDADFFWLVPQERDTVNEAPDFRSDFGAALQYSSPWRYTQNNRNINAFYDPRQRGTRDTEALKFRASSLLYHELGHALDFLPPSQYASLDSSKGPWANIQPRFTARQLTSDAVSAAFPLTSTVMRDLGQVQFQGLNATAQQSAYTPAQVAGFFAGDVASDDYAYSTSREDAAMLFEEFMMFNRLGIRRDVAITDKILATTTNATLIVRWGERGRAGGTTIKPRVRRVVADLVPWLPLSEVDALPAPLAMRAGESWTSNLTLPSPPPSLGLLKLDSPGLPQAHEAWLLEGSQQRASDHRRHGLGKPTSR